MNTMPRVRGYCSSDDAKYLIVKDENPLPHTDGMLAEVVTTSIWALDIR